MSANLQHDDCHEDDYQVVCRPRPAATKPPKKYSPRYARQQGPWAVCKNGAHRRRDKRSYL